MIEAGEQVRIQYNNKVYDGFVSGVLLAFPFVYIPTLGVQFEYSRAALLRAIENKTTLKA